MSGEHRMIERFPNLSSTLFELFRNFPGEIWGGLALLRKDGLEADWGSPLKRARHACCGEATLTGPVRAGLEPAFGGERPLKAA
jgi:hypothetical protein